MVESRAEIARADYRATKDWSPLIFRPDNLRCPHDLWRQLRDEAPVAAVHIDATGRDGFVITRRADVEYIASRPDLYSSTVDSGIWRTGRGELGAEFREILAHGGYEVVNTLVASDPPLAQKYRKIALEALSPKRISARKLELQAIIDSLVNNFPQDGAAFDFRLSYSVPLSLLAIIDMLGLPREDSDFLYRTTNDFLTFVDPATPVNIAVEKCRSFVKGQKYFAEKIEALRGNPMDGFLSYMSNVQDGNGDLLSIEEVISLSYITLIGGNETTRNAISASARHLSVNKHHWRALKDDRSKVPAFVEEIVRFASPAAITPRVATHQSTISDVVIPAGSAIFLVWGSASHDERGIDTPDEVRLDRPSPRAHSSFGHGVHHCAGIHLARTELILSIETWLDRFESMALAIPEADVRHEASWLIQGIERLPMKIVMN